MNSLEYAVDMTCGTALLMVSYFAHSWFAWSIGLTLILLCIFRLDVPLSMLIKALIEKLPFHNKP